MPIFLVFYVVFSYCVAFAGGGVCDFPNKKGRLDQTSGITRTTFNSAIDEVEDIFSPMFERWGCPLIVLRSWQDTTINAQAWQQNGFCFVEMFGGLARYPGMGKRTMQLVLCHEIGHHIGGAPYYSNTRMSVEGQSDYFATYDCMKRIGVNPETAALNMAKILAELNDEEEPSRETRAQEKVTRTLQGHPRAQCRLDTYDAAYLNQARPRCWYAGR